MSQQGEVPPVTRTTGGDSCTTTRPRTRAPRPRPTPSTTGSRRCRERWAAGPVPGRRPWTRGWPPRDRESPRSAPAAPNRQRARSVPGSPGSVRTGSKPKPQPQPQSLAKLPPPSGSNPRPPARSPPPTGSSPRSLARPRPPTCLTPPTRSPGRARSPGPLHRHPRRPPHPPPESVDYVGSGPPTYDAEPTALPSADPDDLDDLVADTVLDGARYGACTLRAVSVRGDSARYRGEPRRDSLLTARFGTGEQALILVAMATGARATPARTVPRPRPVTGSAGPSAAVMPGSPRT